MNLWDNDITTDRRPYVMELQGYLRALQREQTGTTTVPLDGIFGPDTTAGVIAFQTASNLPPSGTVDRVTWDKLVSAYRESQQRTAPPLLIRGLRANLLRPGDGGDGVVFLNTMLGITEFIYTADTAAAVRTIQQASQLPVTGNTDKATWDAVVRLYNQGGSL